MKLSYQKTSPSGDILNVYDETISGRTISALVGPFETLGEARTYGDAYVEGWGMVYFPRASVETIDEKFFVKTSRSTSCD